MNLHSDNLLNPEAFIGSYLKHSSLMGEGFSQPVLFAVKFIHEQYYFPQQPLLELVAVMCLAHTPDNSTLSMQGAIFRATAEVLAQIAELPEELSAAKIFAAQHQTSWLDFSAPLMLEPVHIPKPWGQEIWYTGIEARGQSRVSAQGFSIPLPWVLALLPEYLSAGRERSINLLKVLDPLPDEVYGDLYFEMHEQKQEVYVVTHVDEKAWPKGEGAIQFGFDQTQRATFESDDAFKQAYLLSVKNYEEVRRAIDVLLDQKRIAFGMALSTPLTAKQLSDWLAELSQESIHTLLFEREKQLRCIMNSFVAQLPLKVGDVVTVPCFTPHSLQHGVRAVEFQTPVYERQILSFAQKVLTQAHWDTAAAIQKASLDAPKQKPLELLSSTPTTRIERVCQFDDFEVLRIGMAANNLLELKLEAYALVMVLQGKLEVNASLLMFTGQASFIPACLGRVSFSATEDCLLLVSTPC